MANYAEKLKTLADTLAGATKVEKPKDESIETLEKFVNDVRGILPPEDFFFHAGSAYGNMLFITYKFKNFDEEAKKDFDKLYGLIFNKK